MNTECVYFFDGTFNGLLCCLFECYEKKEFPRDVFPLSEAQATLFRHKEIPTNPAKAVRVRRAIPRKLGADAWDFIRKAFLTQLPDRFLRILQFLRLGFAYGPRVMQMLTREPVCTLYKAVRNLEMEAHHFLGFLRFSAYDGVLFAEIEPKNDILPLVTRHFCERFPEERFLIHDRTHETALVYEPYRYTFQEASVIEPPEAGREELLWRSLWRLFHRTVEIRPRHNPQCQQTHLPQRFRGLMTEFQPDEASLLEA